MSRRLVVRVANCEGVSERDPSHEARLALTKAGAYGVPDVVLLSEVSWCNVPRVALMHAVGSEVVQYGEAGSPQAGVAIVSRLPIRKRPMIEGSARTSEGGGIRMRPIVGGVVLGMPVWSIHAPPPRANNAQAAYVRRARGRQGIVGGDWNYGAEWMHDKSAREYRGIGVLGILVPNRADSTRAKPVDIGSDHDASDSIVTW